MTRPSPRRPLAACLALVLAGCSVGSRLPRTASGPTVLQVQGDVKGGPFQLGEADLAALPQRTVRGVDPASGAGKETRFSGVDLAEVLSERLELTGEADTVVFRTADRMAVPVPFSVVRQLRPVLFDRADDVRVESRGVAWPTFAQQGLSSDPRAPGWWAHGVTAIEVVSGARTLGKALHVPEGAPPGARAGAAVYGARCVSCHQLRGRGGLRGPDLTRATDRLAPADLRRVLAGHPGWRIPGQAEPTAQDAAQLDTFLRTTAAYAALPDPRPDEGDGATAEPVEAEPQVPLPPPGPMIPPPG
jgi:mono/diheme cytochrome c family protein